MKALWQLHRDAFASGFGAFAATVAIFVIVQL